MGGSRTECAGSPWRQGAAGRLQVLDADLLAAVDRDDAARVPRSLAESKTARGALRSARRRRLRANAIDARHAVGRLTTVARLHASVTVLRAALSLCRARCAGV